DFEIDLKLDERPHGFITAYRPEYSEEQYREMTELLEAEMKYSGLGYVKAEIGNADRSAEVFCLIDSRFPPDDFVRLMVRLCSKFRQARVLVTKPGRVPPGPERDRPGAIGQFYDARGTILGEMKNVSMAYVWEYFGWILGGRVEDCRIVEEVSTQEKDIYNWISAMGGHAEFQKKYAD
ncbi:MAG: hypothetical protein LUD72_12335, partial [Bacteroidales bacterium]|nr:hypothetical protein [Bacteroidales bacterium]